jgi:hypothetical protein
MKPSEIAFQEICNDIGKQVAVIFEPTGERKWLLLSSFQVHDDKTLEFRGKVANVFIDAGVFTATAFQENGRLNYSLETQITALVSQREVTLRYNQSTQFIIYK